MSHSLVKCWIHAITGTKFRKPLINFSIEQLVYDYIRQELKYEGCHVKIVNGMPDHVHALFLLNPNKSISDVMKMVKGSSSHWINANNLIAQKFAWQGGFAAYSVSESQVEKVYNYIKNQKQHHKRKSYESELEELARLHQLNFNLWDGRNL